MNTPRSCRRSRLWAQAVPVVLLAGSICSSPAQFSGVHRELYFNLSRDGFSLARLTNHPSFLAGRPDQTNILTASFETETMRGDDYGQRLRSFLIPPATGNYTFWIASDETSNLYLSTSENPDQKQRIAWVDPRSQDNDYTTHFGQQSALIPLEAGRRYYIEALHHEAGLIDHMSVQWRLPSQLIESPIPASRLVYEIPPLLTTNLAGLEVEEGRSAVFEPAVANFLLQSYRWQRDGIDIPGATNRIHTIPAVTLADHGALFRAFITNRAGMTNTAEVLLAVTADVRPPEVTSVVTANATNLFVTFSEPVNSVSALDLDHYDLVGASLLAAEPGPSLEVYILTTSPLTPEVSYTIGVSGILDRASTPNALIATQIVFTAREFILQAVGSPVQPGSATPAGGGLDLVGGGTGLGGSSDQLEFGWQSVFGDFDVQTRVDSLEFADLGSQAGLLVRESLASGSRFAAALATPSLAGCFFEHRTNAGAFAVSTGSFPASFPSMWLRLRRAGNTFAGLASQDGVNWFPLGSVAMNLPARVYLGLAVSSRNTNQTVTARFRQFGPATTPIGSPQPLRTEPLGPSSRKTGLVLSEIMYHPPDVLLNDSPAELEFVEIFNSNPFYEDLGGYRLSGDIDFGFPEGTRIEGGAFLVVARNPAHLEAVWGAAAVIGPFTNNLPNGSGQIRLRNNNDFILLEANYSSRYPWPASADGAGHSLVLARASRGEGQRPAWAASDAIGGSPGRFEPVGVEPLRPIVINEILAHTDELLLDFIELYNHSLEPLDVGGAWLTDNPATNKFLIPSPTVIPGRGFKTFYQDELGFALSSAGEHLFLVNPSQTRVLDSFEFGAQANGVAFGRYPDGSDRFQELSMPTPDNPNAGPLRREVVINEIMYHPISENSDDEFVELVNVGTNDVSLAGWQFIEGIQFEFPSNALITAGGYAVIARNRTNLLARYPGLNADITFGDYDGTLANDGERLAIAMPELAINIDNAGNPDTNVILVAIDEVDYRDGGSWGQWSDGGGSSLELIDPRADNRLGANWADSDETAKAPWSTNEHTGVLDLGGDAPDSLHIYLLEEGECLIDDVEVLPQGGANRIANPSFESGLTGWSMSGNHERSSLQNTGFNSAASLHVRASSRGDVGPNKIRVPFTQALTVSQTATLRAKVRWLRGWPEILLRLRGSYLEATDRMILPSNLGTPGAPNSRFTANAGPAIDAVTHTPAVPAAGQSVVVTARVSDPDGLSTLVVRYRVDPASALDTVTMRDDGLAGDALAGDGVFSATIPGQPADTLVAFVIEATDAALVPASSRFPSLRDDNSRARECLVHFGSPVPAGSFGTYRLWITRQSITNWSQREVLSNERIPGTFVYGNHRVIYNATARYSGSAAHQDQAFPDYSPVGTPNNYALDMPRDDLLLGTDNFNKIHGAGNNHHDDNTLLREVTAYWIAQRLGLPANNKRFVAMFINGARRGALMEDTQIPNGEVLESVFPGDSEGDLFKISVWYEFGLTGPALSFTTLSEGYLNNYVTTGGVKKRARYRPIWQPRAIHGTANDFTNLYTLVNAANAPQGPTFEPNLGAIADMENWMRTFALEHAVGNWDSFGYRNEQNMFAYKPQRGRWSLLIWDINILFGGGTRGVPIATNGDLFEIDTNDAPMPVIYNVPAWRRAYWRALRELVQDPFLNARVDPFLDARFNAFAASGVSVTAPDAIKTWISQRRAHILAELARIDAPAFTLASASEFTTSSNSITLSGLAPVGIQTLAVNGIAWPVTWTTVTNWTLRMALANPTNPVTVVGLDSKGQPVPGASNAVTILYPGPLPPPENHIVLNEIHYHPPTPEGSFVELFNTSSNVAFDLSGWRLNGLDFTFPQGAFISSRQFLVLAKNRGVYGSLYGLANPVAGEFDGQLDDGGETLTLFRPGPTPNQDTLIDRVRYDDDPPWPAAADGFGPSLQLMDATQDNSRPANWSGDPGWIFVSRTGNIANATNLVFWISTAAAVYLDDITLIGPAGTNIVVNGDFESDLGAPWLFGTNYTNSILVNNVSHSGQRSLLLIGTFPGTANLNTTVQQRLGSSVQTNTTYTLSYFCFEYTNSVAITMRTLPGVSLATTTNSGKILATPGLPNAFASILSPFPPLWINEIQPNNAGDLLDNAGDPDPWIELVNTSSNNVSFDNLYLTDDFNAPLKWPIPTTELLGPDGFRLLWADDETFESTPSIWHTSFRLHPAAGSIALVRLANNRPQYLDYIHYAGPGPGLSYGSFPDGQPFDRRVFQTVTPQAGNVAPAVSVLINEWLAANAANLADPADSHYEDWFELYNAGDLPVDLAGYYLSDDPLNPDKFHIRPGYLLPPRGYLLVWADEESGQNRTNLADLHVNFRLSSDGESVGLYDPDLDLVDEVHFGKQTNDISQGRFADGAGAIYYMPTPTPRGPNRLSSGNSPPTLEPISDKSITLGQTLVFFIPATDPDLPLFFLLDEPTPQGATLHPSTGRFEWTPAPTEPVPAIHVFTVRVRDSGVPALEASRVFNVLLLPPPRLTGLSAPLDGVLTLSWEAIAGKHYRVEFKTDLNEDTWQLLSNNIPAFSTALSINDSLQSNPQRFYRISILD